MQDTRGRPWIKLDPVSKDNQTHCFSDEGIIMGCPPYSECRKNFSSWKANYESFSRQRLISALFS